MKISACPWIIENASEFPFTFTLRRMSNITVIKLYMPWCYTTQVTNQCVISHDYNVSCLIDPSMSTLKLVHRQRNHKRSSIQNMLQLCAVDAHLSFIDFEHILNWVHNILIV